MNCWWQQKILRYQFYLRMYGYNGLCQSQNVTIDTANEWWLWFIHHHDHKTAQLSRSIMECDMIPILSVMFPYLEALQTTRVSFLTDKSGAIVESHRNKKQCMRRSNLYKTIGHSFTPVTRVTNAWHSCVSCDILSHDCDECDMRCLEKCGTGDA